jgi:hypothetical protein
MAFRRAPIGVAALAALAASTFGCDRGAPPAAAPQAPAAGPPVVAASPSMASLLTSADVDARLRAEWDKAGLTPTPPASDATWLRRAWLDALGSIPPPELVQTFLADSSSGKRDRAIDEMLASPSWADHWTAYWDDVWMGRDPRRPDVDPGAFRAWLHAAFARNAPWNEVVTELLTATGRNSAGGLKADARVNDGRTPAPPEVHGAVNWTLKYQDDPQDMAGTASRTLLGVQLQCAQCHDHKTEKWTQGDFQRFAAAFVRTRLEPVEPRDQRAMDTREVKRVDLSDLPRPAPRFAKKMDDLGSIIQAKPTALDGTDLGGGKEVREALARWMTSPVNPWFARAFVNRMWGHFLGRGFVDPVDDMRPSNPPTAPELLDALAADFVASGFDVKHVGRIILGSAAYGSSAAPLPDAVAKADPAIKLWERFRVTPLGPEELLDALIAATGLDAVVRETGRLDLVQVRFRVKERYGFLFDVDEETDERDYDGTIAQGLALLNGSVVAAGASLLPGSALGAILAAPGGDPAKIEALYLRTLSRPPTDAETARWTAFLRVAEDTAPAARREAPSKRDGDAAARAAPPQQPDPLRGLENRAGKERADGRARAYEDMLWTLLNSSEFVLNH